MMAYRKLSLSEQLLGGGGYLRCIREIFPLAILFGLIFMAQVSPLEAQEQLCDTWVQATTVEKERFVCGKTDPNFPDNTYCEYKTVTEHVPAHFKCRSVPNYFHDNARAKMRLIEEITRRKDREAAGGARFTMPNPLVDGTRTNYGYRCPDARGECPNVWIPSPGGGSGLSKPRSFAGGSDLHKANVYIQRINGSGIGDPEILADKPIDAVDIWGTGADTNRKVCFLGEGRITYVDTDAMPRSKRSLSTTVEGEGDNTRTCANVPGRGQVIFLPL